MPAFVVQTPLQRALWRQCVPLVQLLLHHRATLQGKPRPVTIAARKGNLRLAKLLLEAKSNPTRQAGAKAWRLFDSCGRRFVEPATACTQRWLVFWLPAIRKPYRNR